jgi:hypothetical protein
LLSQRIPTANWSRSNGSESVGSRLGGLGGAPQHVRDLLARCDTAMQHLTEFQRQAVVVVIGKHLKPDQTCYTPEEFGGHVGQHLGGVLDRNRRWGLSHGVVLAVGDELADVLERLPRPRYYLKSER